MLTKTLILSEEERFSASPPFLLFDIATTGLRAGDAFLTSVALTDGSEIKAFLAESFLEEYELIQILISAFRGAEKHYAYRPTSFDLPFLISIGDHYRVPFPYDVEDVTDITSLLRPCASALPFSLRSFPELEKVLGGRRLTEGREFAELYASYRREGSPFDEKLLSSMIFSLRVQLKTLRLGLFLSDPHLPSLSAPEKTEGALNFTSPLPSLLCGMEFSSLHEDLLLEAKGEELSLAFPLKEKTLATYLDHDTPYDYLILEDRIIPHSLGRFLDPKVRRKAKASEYFLRKTGVFLPQAFPSLSPVFRTGEKAVLSYYELTEDAPLPGKADIEDLLPLLLKESRISLQLFRPEDF